MIFQIKHTTRYRYNRPVFCRPTTVRLHPRDDAAQRVLRHSLWIDPQPAGVSSYVDLDGSTATRFWFDSTQTALSVVMSCTVETLRTNPFAYLLDPQSMELPIVYPPQVRRDLESCFTPTSTEPAILEAAATIVREADGKTTPFLMTLAGWIADNFESVVRPDGEPRPAAETLARRSGACRDLVVLYNEICRVVGVAARFVSGYQADPEADGHRHLHAWSEVYLPGAGWRGFDPSSGLAVADRHVALCASASPELTVPLAGSFHGDGAEATMETQLVIGVKDSAGDAATVSGAA
jgi:transglutaminase-like putative cysteine protease